MTAEEKTRGTRAGDSQLKTVLYFDGHRKYGFAKSGGVSIDIDEIPPNIPLPKQTTNVSFYQEANDYWLKESTGAPRKMHSPEVEAVQAFLASIAEFGRKVRRSWGRV